jgi:hypothetical protein
MAEDPWLRLDAEAGVTLSLAGRPATAGPRICGAGRPASWMAGWKAATPARSSSSAASAAIILTWITPISPPCLQEIRGPYTPGAGLAAHENDLGPETGG